MTRIEDITSQLEQLRTKREDANLQITKVETQLGALVQYRTKIDGAVEWLSSQMKAEQDAEADRHRRMKEEEALKKEPLTQS